MPNYRLKPRTRTRFTKIPNYNPNDGCDEDMEGMERYYPQERNPEYEDFPME
jgi:hypothetical protein